MNNKSIFRLFKISYIIILFICYCNPEIYSQTDSIDKQPAFLSIGLRAHKGFIIPHSKSIRDISYSRPWIIEADVSWHFSDINAWQYCNCYPRVGISYMYIDFNNEKILGHAQTLAPYVEPFLSAHRKLSASIKFATGIVYLDNVYDSIKNPDNLFFSSHISYLLSAGITLNYRITQCWNLRVSGNYNHISNGGNKMPNKGMNFPTIAFGFDYSLKPVHFSARDVIIKEKNENKHSIKTGLLATLKKPFIDKNTQYFLYGCYVNYSYLLGRLSAITSGLEYVNDGALKEYLEKTTESPPDHKRIGILAGHELQIGRFRFSQQLGVYLYSPAKAKDPVYQRWGLDCSVSKNFFVGLNLKAHRHVADFMDFRAGYIW